MVGSKSYNEFLVYAKMCSVELTVKYLRGKNNGRNVDGMMIKIRLLMSMIKTLESLCGRSRKMYMDGCDPCYIEVESCFNCKEICNLVDKMKSICNC
jgi:hypothetical protein